MYKNTKDVMLTALAPLIWGSSYIVATTYLPEGYPLTIATLRALPVGVLLLLMIQRLPPCAWLLRIFFLGALNFSIFWTALFISAFSLPGGVAATLGSVQPLFVMGFSALLLKTPLSLRRIGFSILGIFGVSLLILGPDAALDSFGIGAAVVGAASMALGVVLTRWWQEDVSPLTFTAWQLTAGGMLLLPAALYVEPMWPRIEVGHLIGLSWLGLIGAGASYVLWFRGIAILGPTVITPLGFLSPLSAVLLGWVFLEETLSSGQLIGAAVIIVSVWQSQRVSDQPSNRRGTVKSLSVPEPKRS